MPQRKFDGGAAAAMLCAFYPGITPWNLEDLTDEQRDLFLSHIGLIRYYRDLPYLQKMFSAIDDEGIEKIISGASSPTASRRALAWDIWALKPYGLLADEAEADESAGPFARLSPEAAEGIVQWWESGDLHRLPEGQDLWVRVLLPVYKQLIRRAEEMTVKSPR